MKKETEKRDSTSLFSSLSLYSFTLFRTCFVDFALPLEESLIQDCFDFAQLLRCGLQRSSCAENRIIRKSLVQSAEPDHLFYKDAESADGKRLRFAGQDKAPSILFSILFYTLIKGTNNLVSYSGHE